MNGFSRLALTAVGVAVAMGAAVTWAQSPIDGRKDLMKQNAAAQAQITPIARGTAPWNKDVALAAATTINNNSKRIIALFPAGSDAGATNAKPEIWANFADFTAKEKALEDASGRLIQLASANDEPASRPRSRRWPAPAAPATRRIASRFSKVCDHR